jgi:excisionase family DNA binding protein
MPPAALKLIGQLLGAMSPGRAISVVPSQNEFTAVKAAHFLNVSRPFVIKEIELGRLPHRMVGTHRRIAFGDLMADANEMRERRESAFDRMAGNARDLGLDLPMAGNARDTATLDAFALYSVAQTDARLSLATAGLFGGRFQTEVQRGG